MNEKIAILGDTHFGIRNGSELYLDYFFEFYRNTFIPYIKKHDIKIVIQTGDVFDKRKGIDFRSLNRVKNEFLDPLKELDVTLHTFPGNHDIFHRHSNNINSVTELISHYDNVIITNEPTQYKISKNCYIDMIPWMNKNNVEETLEFIKKSESDYCVGHFEIGSFEMQKGIAGHNGLNASVFNHYQHVISGHYHTRSTRKNITYVGVPYQMTWADWNDIKGFHIFVPETNELTFIENSCTLYQKLFYSSDINMSEFNFDELNNSVIKLIIQDRKDLFHYERFMDNIEKVKPYSLSVVEADLIVAYGVDEEAFEALDTFNVLKESALEIAAEQGLNINIMEKHLCELHTEALADNADI